MSPTLTPPDWEERPPDWTNGEKLMCWLIPIGAGLVALVVYVLETVF